MRNSDGLVLNRLSKRINGRARMLKPSRVLLIGIKAARPAPNQCIRPVATKIMDIPRTNQKPVRQKNALRFSDGSRLTTVHQYQTDRAMAIRKINLGIVFG